MPIPDYQSIMLPLLKQLSDGEELKNSELFVRLADDYQLSEDGRRKLLPSGQQPIFYNRVGWARTYLKIAGLIEYPKRGANKITERALQVLGERPDSINVKFLKRFKEYREHQARKKATKNHTPGDFEDPPENTPVEVLEAACENLRNKLAGELCTDHQGQPAQPVRKDSCRATAENGLWRQPQGCWQGHR